MNRFTARLTAVLFAAVFCMGILAGCAGRGEPAEPDDYEDEEYYDDDYYEDDYYEDDDEYYEDDDEYYEDDDEYYEDDEEYYEDEEDDAKEKPGREEEGNKASGGAEMAAGKWYTEDYDEDANWALSYVIELKKDGTATCKGYRNRDTGTYKVTGPDKVLITFDFCETDEPDAGWVAAEGYSYTVEMTIDGDDAEIKVNAPGSNSNLEDGTVHRE